jgi:hypothetical protein
MNMRREEKHSTREREIREKQKETEKKNSSPSFPLLEL